MAHQNKQTGSGFEEKLIFGNIQLRILATVLELNKKFAVFARDFKMDKLFELIMVKSPENMGSDESFNYDIDHDVNGFSSALKKNPASLCNDTCAASQDDCLSEEEAGEFSEESPSSHSELPATESKIESIIDTLSDIELYHCLLVLRDHKFATLSKAQQLYNVDTNQKIKARKRMMKDVSKWILHKLINYYTLKALYYTNPKAFTAISTLKFNLLWFRYVPYIKFLPIPISLSPFVFVYSMAFAYILATVERVSTKDKDRIRNILQRFSIAFTRFNQNKMRTIERILMIAEEKDVMRKTEMLRQVLKLLKEILEEVLKATQEYGKIKNLYDDTFLSAQLYQKIGVVRAVFRKTLQYAKKDTIHDRLAHQMITIIWVSCDILQSHLAHSIIEKADSTSARKKCLQDTQQIMHKEGVTCMRDAYESQKTKCGCSIDEVLASALDLYVPFYKYTCVSEEEAEKYTNAVKKLFIDFEEDHDMSYEELTENIMKDKTSSRITILEYMYKVIMANAAKRMNCGNDAVPHPVEKLMPLNFELYKSQDIEELVEESFSETFTQDLVQKEHDRYRKKVTVTPLQPTMTPHPPKDPKPESNPADKSSNPRLFKRLFGRS
jgi:hypothetical protein